MQFVDLILSLPHSLTFACEFSKLVSNFAKTGISSMTAPWITALGLFFFSVMMHWANCLKFLFMESRRVLAREWESLVSVSEAKRETRG